MLINRCHGNNKDEGVWLASPLDTLSTFGIVDTYSVELVKLEKEKNEREKERKLVCAWGYVSFAGHIGRKPS